MEYLSVLTQLKCFFLSCWSLPVLDCQSKIPLGEVEAVGRELPRGGGSDVVTDVTVYIQLDPLDGPVGLLLIH